MDMRRRRRDSFDAAHLMPWEQRPVMAFESLRGSSLPPRSERRSHARRPAPGTSSCQPPRLAVDLNQLSHNLGAHSNCAGACGVAHTLAALSGVGALFTPLGPRGLPRSRLHGAYGPGMALLRQMQDQAAAAESSARRAADAAAAEDMGWLNVVLARRAQRVEAAGRTKRTLGRSRRSSASWAARSLVGSAAAGPPPTRRATMEGATIELPRRARRSLLFPYINSGDAGPPSAAALRESTRARTSLALAAVRYVTHSPLDSVSQTATAETLLRALGTGARRSSLQPRVRRGSV